MVKQIPGIAHARSLAGCSRLATGSAVFLSLHIGTDYPCAFAALLFLQGEGGAAFGGGGGGVGGGGEGFEFGVDPNLDPELAMALQVCSGNTHYAGLGLIVRIASCAAPYASSSTQRLAVHWPCCSQSKHALATSVVEGCFGKHE